MLPSREDSQAAVAATSDLTDLTDGDSVSNENTTIISHPDKENGDQLILQKDIQSLPEVKGEVLGGSCEVKEIVQEEECEVISVQDEVESHCENESEREVEEEEEDEDEDEDQEENDIEEESVENGGDESDTEQMPILDCPEIPQKVAFTDNLLAESEESEERSVLTEEVKQEQLICLDDEQDERQVEVLKSKENDSVTPSSTGEGEVVEILNKLECLKTPEPDEVESGIVRASFVDFVMDEPVEEQSDDGDGEGDDGESVEIFQVGDMMASNPELQRIRQEQVQKWLKFEEENPIMEDKVNGGMYHTSTEASEDGEDGELTGNDVDRRVRFLTDTEGNLLISVFMSKLVHLFLFFLKVASGGYLDLHSFSRSTNTTTSTSSSTSSNAELISSSHHSNDSLILIDSCVVTVETECNRVDQRRLIMNESHFVVNRSIPTVEPLSEEGSMGSNLSNAHSGEGNPAVVVSPPSLDPQINNMDTVPTAPPAELEDEFDSDDDDVERDQPSIVLVLGENKEPQPPTEKPPAPPVDDVDEGCNSSDETLSVSSCNSMIEIMPNTSSSNSNSDPIQSQSSDPIDQDILDLEPDASEISTVAQEEPDLLAEEEAATNLQIEKTMEAHLVPVPAPDQTPTIQIDQPEVNENENESESEGKDEEDPDPGEDPDAESNVSSQPPSFIIHDIEEQDEDEDEDLPEINEPKTEEPTDEIIKLPNVDENNNVVDSNENDKIPATQSSELKPEIDLRLEERDDVAMPELQMSHSSTSSQSDGEEERFISALSEQLPSVKDSNLIGMDSDLGIVPPTSKSEEQENHEQQMVSLCIQEEHISSVALTIAKWESMSKAQSTENLSTTPTMHHPPVTKCSSSPCPKMVKSLATAIEQVNPVPVAPINPIPSQSPVQQNYRCNSNGPISVSSDGNQVNNRDECNNNNNNINSSSSNSSTTTTKVVSVSVNNALNSTNHHAPAEPLVVTKAPGWNCWGNKLKDPKPLDATNVPLDSDEIIYAQPNHQAGSTMTSIANPSAILKQYPKPLSKGEIVMWLKEGEIHRAGLLLTYGQSHHHAPVLATPNNVPPVLVSWFFGLISRHQAEKYLHGQPPGTFLVRISTRIWGYTLSYQAANGRTKHFLISAVNPAVPATLQTNIDAALPPQTGKQQRMSPFIPQGRYAFIGTNMTPYGTLVSLIRHHSHAPITKLGGEKLLNPCPGGPQVAGLENLFK